MKTTFAGLALLAALGAAGASGVFARDDTMAAGSPWLMPVAETRSEPSANQLAPYGYASSGPASRVVNIDSRTRYLNVTRQETIQINYDGKSIVWTFDTLGTAAFPLSRIVPGAEGVTVYMKDDPLYQPGY